MLDLRAQLLKAGLVTQEQIESSKKKLPKKKVVPVDEGNFEQKQRLKQLEDLKKMTKGEQYDVFKRWIKRNRLDKPTEISDTSEKFFFPKTDGNITWLTLSPEVHAQIVEGKAGIIMYMSDHGLSHCAVPRDIAEDVAEIFPIWLRALKDDARAGAVAEAVTMPTSSQPS